MENKTENNKKEEKKRIRREYAQRGTRSGKMQSFRLDWTSIKALETVKNKSRLVNDLIKAWRDGKQYEGDEVSPKENDLEEYFT